MRLVSFLFIVAATALEVHALTVVPGARPAHLYTPAHRRRRCSLPLMQQIPMGGDLAGGRNESRNAEVSSLKRLFYSAAAAPSVAEPSPPAGASSDTAAKKLGLYLDLPLTRWAIVFLPGQQLHLNVFQPEYVHLFETLLAQPRPWRYLQVWMPPGPGPDAWRRNLASDEYALPGLSASGERGGDRATLHGTLMEVVSVRRRSDARLALVVQGLRRAVVLRGTQSSPFARADVRRSPRAARLVTPARHQSLLQ